MNWVDLMVLGICAFIFWQDLRERAVYWLLFPALFVLGFIRYYSIEMMEQWGFSLLLFLFLMGALSVYLTLKNGKWINITKGFFSWGDILFLLASIPFFLSFNYLYFFTFGTMVTLLFHVLSRTIKKSETIPYAGYMSVVLAVTLIMGWNVKQFTFLLS